MGIAGSANTEGTVRTAGIMGNGTADPIVKRAVIIWSIAVVALVFFHVGGSKL